MKADSILSLKASVDCLSEWSQAYSMKIMYLQKQASVQNWHTGHSLLTMDKVSPNRDPRNNFLYKYLAPAVIYYLTQTPRFIVIVYVHAITQIHHVLSYSCLPCTNLSSGHTNNPVLSLSSVLFWFILHNISQRYYHFQAFLDS